MTNYSFSNNIDFSFNVKSKFTYNFYDKNESLVNDNEIINKLNNPLSFIELEIDYLTQYDKRIEKYSSFYDLSLKDSIQVLNNKSLRKSNLSLFNKLHEENESFISTSSDIKIENIEDYNKKLNISSSGFESAISFITDNKKIEINRNILKKYKETNRKNIITSKNILNSINKFEKLFRKSQYEDSFFNSIEIAESFNPFKISSMSEFIASTEMFYFKNIGIMIEKYFVEEDDIETNYIKKDTKFFNIEDENNNNKKSFLLRDDSVKYGKKYVYAVYPVYVVTLPYKNDYYLTSSYILCDYPHVTEEIICKEFKRPVSPSRISFRYFEKERFLEINWSKPLEEQGDVKGYQIFKRNTLDEPYTLIKQIEFFDTENDELYEKNKNVSLEIIEKVNFDKNYCNDKDFLLNKIQIYTICSIDARGYVSNYSMQLAVFYDQINKEIIIDTVSISGAPLHMPNLLIPRKTKFFENDDKIVNNTPYEENVTKFTLYLTPECTSVISEDGADNRVLLKENYKLNVLNLNTAESYINNINIKNI
jgi:hypothetical protein